MNNKYKTLISILFFLFFTTPILSPSIGNSTFYIHWIIPFFDFDFLRSVLDIKMKKTNIFMIIILIIVCIALFEFKLALEILLLIETIMYLFYCKKINTFKYLYWGVNFNIIIAIIQFILYYISPELAKSIGPGNISRLLWGSHATATFTNMFENEFGLVRVSGWSREAGFFNSLIIMTFITYYYTEKKEDRKKYQYILFIIAFIISLSKVSIIPIIIIPIIKLRKYINKIPYIIGIALILFIGICASDFLLKNNQYDNRYTKNYETFTHRFSGYTIMKQLNIKDLIKGIDTLDQLPENVKNNNQYLRYIYRFQQFCGVPSMIIHNGLIIFAIFMITLKKIGFKTSDLFIVTIATLTVNYTTQTSFVVLIYYVVLKLNILDNQKNMLGDGQDKKE